MTSFSQIVVTLAGVGYLPASGTFASALSAVLFFFFFSQLDWLVQLMIIFAVLFAATLLCNKASVFFDTKDPSQIVIDEFVGMWIALVFIPVTMTNITLIFCLFRALDIYKPGPVGWADKQLTGGWGIMADDVIAGLLCTPFSLILLLLSQEVSS